jgi:acyl-CoA thioesterase FadM
LNLWFRLLLTWAFGRFRPRCGPTDACITPFRVLPTDLDAAVHMNNGVYFSILDLARVDLTLRSGLQAILRAHRWFPVVVGETIQFHRELRPFQRFFVETRLLGWDERTIFIRHRLFRHRPQGELAAEAMIRGVIVRRSGGTVPTAELLDALRVPAPQEPIPDWVRAWARALDANREEYKRRSK